MGLSTASGGGHLGVRAGEEVSRRVAGGTSPSRASSRRRVVGCSAAVASFAAAMYWLVLPPPYFADAYNYFTAARRWPNIFTAPAGDAHEWPFVPVDLKMWHVTRTGLVLPTRLVQELFGTGQLAYGVVSALLVAVFAVGCYLAGRALFGNAVGVAAAFVYLVHPYFTMGDTHERDVVTAAAGILPDLVGSGLYAVGVAGVAVAARRSGRARTAMLVAAGLGFATAYLAREFTALMYAAIPVYFWLLRLPPRRLVTVAAPMLAVFVAEIVYSAAIFRDPLARLRVAGTQVRLDEPASVTDALLRFWQSATNWHPLGILFVAALGITVAGWAVTRDRRLAVTLVWFLSLWIPITVLSGILDPSHPSLRAWVVRYWTPVYPALLIGALGALVLLGRRLRGRGLRVAGLAALAGITAVGYLAPAGREIQGENRDRDWNELRVWLARQAPISAVHTDIRTGQTLYFYVRNPLGEPIWDGSVVAFPPRRRAVPDTAADGPLLVSRWTFAAGAPSESSGWRLIWRSDDGALRVWTAVPAGSRSAVTVARARIRPR